MPKYIDADALRKRMEQIAEESKPAATARPMREDTPSELLRYGTARAMIEWLDEIPAADVEPKQKWIPVTERLPKDDTIVLVVSRQHHDPYPAFQIGGVWHDGYLVACSAAIDMDDEETIDNSGITHWIPRPEPPKETDGDEQTAETV